MRVEKKREPGHRESKHVCTYCLPYPAPTNGTRVEINKLFDKGIFHSVDSSDIKVFFSHNLNICILTALENNCSM